MNSTRSTLIGTAVAIALFGHERSGAGAAARRSRRHRHPRLEREIARHEARCELGRRGRHRRGHRQDAGQERRRFAVAAPRRHGQLGQRQRRRVRRERPHQHARHQSEPDADADQRSQRRGRRLVRVEPGPAGRSQRQLHAAAVGARRPDRRAQELAGVARRGRRRGLGRHHHAQAARLHRSVHVRARRPASSTPSCRTRSIRSSAPSSTGRTTPARSASWCRRSPRSGTCVATASRCSVTGRSRPAAPSRPRIRTCPASQYPVLIGAALFEQKRERTGGLVDIEFRPSDDLRLDLQYFMSDLDATNYNRNFLFWTRNILQGGAGHRQAPDPGYVVRNNTLVEASLVGPGHAVHRRLRPDLAARTRRRLRTTAASAPATRSATPSRCPARSGRRRVTARRRRRTSPKPFLPAARAAAIS